VLLLAEMLISIIASDSDIIVDTLEISLLASVVVFYVLSVSIISDILTKYRYLNGFLDNICECPFVVFVRSAQRHSAIE